MESEEPYFLPLQSNDNLINIQIELDEYVTGICWLNNKHLAASTAAGTLYFIDIEIEKVLHKIKAHKGPIQSISSNLKNFVATGGQDGFFKIFEWGNITPICETKLYTDWIEKVAYSPNGEKLLVVAGNKFSLYQTNGELVYQSIEHESTISDICWKSDSQQFASACYSAVRFFDVEQANAQNTLEWKNSMISISWSPNANFLCSGTQDSRIHFWPLPYKKGSDFEMSGYRGKVRNLSWDSTSNYVASNCWNEVIVWPFHKNKPPLGKKPIMLAQSMERITTLKFQNNSTVLAVGDKVGTLVFYDPITGEEYLAAVQLNSEITHLEWAPNDNFLAVGTANGGLHIINDIS